MEKEGEMLKEFVVSDVFGNAQHRKYHPPETLVPDDDGYPYICASNQNNGINKSLPYVNGADIQLTPQKIIAWGKQCPMFCYHDRPCVCSQGMYFLDMTEYAEEICLYVCGALSAATHGKYNYSNCLTGEKMDREHVSLPVVESKDEGHVYTTDDIDWNYMRSRVRKLEQERVRELEAYLKAAGLESYELSDEDRNILALHKNGGGIRLRDSE